MLVFQRVIGYFKGCLEPVKMKQSQHNRQKKFYGHDLKLYVDYDENLNAWRRVYLERIKKHFLKKNFLSQKIIDIGTGSGYVAVELAKTGMRVLACDLTPLSINNLKRYKKQFSLQNLEAFACPAEKIPLRAKSVDYIVANAILEHIPDERAAIKEWKRILKPGGKIFIVVPLKFRHIWPFFWPLNYINDKMVGHLRRYDKKDLEQKFQMKISKVFYTGHIIKVIWLLSSRIFAMNLRSNFKLDDLIEKIDEKFQSIKYGGSNIVAILEARK